MSASDLAIVMRKMRERGNAEGTVDTIKPVCVTEGSAVAKVVKGSAIAKVVKGSAIAKVAKGSAIATTKVVKGSAVATTKDIFCVPPVPTDSGIARGTTSPEMMPPPKSELTTLKCNATISKKICDITEFPEFAMTSHLTVRFRQCDEKVFIPDLLVVMGKYTMVSEAHGAVLRLMEMKHVCVEGLASLEIDDNLSLVLGKSIILVSFPDAIKLLHHLGICTIDRDASLVVPMIAVPGVVKGGLVAPQSTVSVAPGAAKVDVDPGRAAVIARAVQAAKNPIVGGQRMLQAALGGAVKSSASVASAVVKGGVARKNIISTASSAVRMRIRMQKVNASVLKTISSFENLDDSCLEGKVLRQTEPGQVDENGKQIGGGLWVITDVVSACTGDNAVLAIQWVRKHISVIKKLAKSITFIDSGNSSVSLIKLTNYIYQ